jgi:hypothetical protein
VNGSRIQNLRIAFYVNCRVGKFNIAMCNVELATCSSLCIWFLSNVKLTTKTVYIFGINSVVNDSTSKRRCVAEHVY